MSNIKGPKHYLGTIMYCTPDDINSILDDLSAKYANGASFEELFGVLDDNKENLMINSPLYKELASKIDKSLIENLFNRKSVYKFADINEFRENLHCELALVGANNYDESGIIRLLDVNSDLYSAPQLALTGALASEAEIYRFNKYTLFTDTVKRNIAKNIVKDKPHTFESLKKVFNEQVFLNIVNNSPNINNSKLTWESIGTEIEANKDIIPSYNEYKNLSDNKKAYVQQDLYSKVGKWNTVDDFCKDLHSAIIKQSSSEPSSPSGGKSAGAGGGGHGPAVSGNFPVQDTNIIDEAEPLFKDLDGYEWAQTAISFLYKNNIISGYGNGTFLPNNTIKREEFVKMIVLAFSKFDGNARTTFTDVSEGQWYYSYIASAQSLGVIKGISDTEFGIGLELTRQDLITMMYNFIISTGYQFNEDLVYIPFSDDVYISDYAKEAVKALAACGIIKGVGNNILAPLRPCTRAEAAQILFEVMSKVVN